MGYLFNTHVGHLLNKASCFSEGWLGLCEAPARALSTGVSSGRPGPTTREVGEPIFCDVCCVYVSILYTCATESILVACCGCYIIDRFEFAWMYS